MDKEDVQGRLFEAVPEPAETPKLRHVLEPGELVMRVGPLCKSSRSGRGAAWLVLTSTRFFCFDLESAVIRIGTSISFFDCIDDGGRVTARKVSSSTIVLRHRGRDRFFDVEPGTADEWTQKIELALSTSPL
jgi:hypothetical protein